MIASLLIALAVTPWSHPLAFAHVAGWTSGQSGNTQSVYVGHNKRAAAPLESAAWMAKGVRYRDDPTSDPPNKTLRHLSPQAVIVWAVIYSAEAGQRPVRLSFGAARRFACCEAVGLPGGEYEMTGSGPGRAYSVIVRVYFGARPTSAMRAQAQEALNALQLPSPR